MIPPMPTRPPTLPRHCGHSSRAMRFLPLLLSLLPVFLLASCGTTGKGFLDLPSLSVLPNEIPRNATPATVRSLLGEPAWTEAVSKKGEPPTHVWHYADKWHTQGFCSWEVYFEERRYPDGRPALRYTGWRLTDPPSAETGDREVFHTRRHPPPSAACPTPQKQVK